MIQFINKIYLMPLATLGLSPLTSETTEKEGWKKTQGMTSLLYCPKICSATPTLSWLMETCWNLASNPSSNTDLKTFLHIARRVLQCLTSICLVVMAHLILFYNDISITNCLSLCIRLLLICRQLLLSLQSFLLVELS